MSKVTLGGNEVDVIAGFPKVGDKLKDFVLVKRDLSEVSLKDYAGKNIVFNIFPSIDTGICATSNRVFNQKAADLNNTVVLCVSNDLPFALDRFCSAEGIKNVETLSAFRSDFGKDYGVLMTSGGLKGLLARAVIIANPQLEIIYTQLVPEIKTEPDYEKAINSL